MKVYWYEIASASELAMAEVKALENNTQGLAYADSVQDSESLEAIETMLGEQFYCVMFETFTGDYTNIFVKNFKYDSWHKVYEFEVDNEPTKVNFRIGKEGEIFGLMPEVQELYGRCAIYTFQGHTSGYYSDNIASSKPAPFSSYRGLYLAMLRAGYNVQPIKKFTKR